MMLIKYKERFHYEGISKDYYFAPVGANGNVLWIYYTRGMLTIHRALLSLSMHKCTICTRIAALSTDNSE